MSARCLEQLQSAFRTEMRGDRLPYVVVYGPPYSGKSELLAAVRREITQRRWFPQRRLLVLSFDFGFHAGSWETMLERLVVEVEGAAVRTDPAVQAREGLSKSLRRGRSLVPLFDQLLERALAAGYWGVLLLVDNFHALPNEHAREVCRRLKILKERRTGSALNRLGMILASARSFGRLRIQGDSPFDSYTALSMIPVPGEHAVLQSIIQQGVRKDSQPVAEVERLLFSNQKLAPFRWMMLHVASSARVREIAKLLLDGQPCPMRYLEPDFDMLEETGLFTADREARQYLFREPLLQEVVKRGIEIVEDRRYSPNWPDGSIAAALLAFTTHASKLSNHPTLVECLPLLNELWRFSVSPTDIELWAHAGPVSAAGSEGRWVRVTRTKGASLLQGTSAPELCRHALARSCEHEQSSVAVREVHQAIWHRFDLDDMAILLIVLSVRLSEPSLHEALACHVFNVLRDQEQSLGLAVLQEFGRLLLAQPPDERMHPADTPLTSEREEAELPDPRLVFLVYGRNRRVRDALADRLRRLDLKILEWEMARRATGKGAAASNLDIVQEGLHRARAIVVLMTGDDEARLAEHYTKDDERQEDYTPQPRQNVLIEAGMAMVLKPERTVLVHVGSVRAASDFDGLSVVNLDASPEEWRKLEVRLRDTGCVVNAAEDYLRGEWVV